MKDNEKCETCYYNAECRDRKTKTSSFSCTNPLSSECGNPTNPDGSCNQWFSRIYNDRSWKDQQEKIRILKADLAIKKLEEAGIDYRVCSKSVGHIQAKKRSDGLWLNFWAHTGTIESKRSGKRGINALIKECR